MIRVLSALFLVTLVASGQKKEPEKKKDAPQILYTIPLGVTPGVKQKLTLRGKHLDLVKEVRVGGAAQAKLKVLGGKKTPAGNNQPGDRLGETELEIELELPKGPKSGVSLTAVGAGGESNSYGVLLPNDAQAVPEKEPNDGLDTAQLIPFPAAVDGTIRGDRDTDVFRFKGKKGTRVRIEVEAARFGSPVDAMLSLYDPDRKLLVTVDDVDGSPDPVMTVTLPKDGIYSVTVIEAHDLGGPQFGYRLVVK